MEGYVYESNNKNVLVEEGDYEVTLEKIERRVTGTGREKLSLTFRIRTDVEQSFKNRCVFEDIWSEKENPKFFNRKRINQLLGTQHLEEGTRFENINKIIDFMVGKSLVCHIGVEFDTYKEKDVNVVNYYKSSNVKPEISSLNDETPKSGNLPVVDDDDLPF